MSFVRNLVVVSAQFVPKVLTTLKKDHLTPMGMVEQPEALLFFVNARINVDWVFSNAKIPPEGFRCLWIDDEGDFARTGRLVDSWFGTHFVAHEELRIKGSEMDRLQAEYTKDGFLTLCSRGKECGGTVRYTDPETWQVELPDGSYSGVVGVTTIPSRKGKPETWQVTLADGEEFVVKGVNTRTAKKNAEYYSEGFSVFQSYTTLEGDADGVRTYRIRRPLRTYKDSYVDSWVCLINDKQGYVSSLGSIFAVDENDWWDRNRRGSRHYPNDDDDDWWDRNQRGSRHYPDDDDDDLLSHLTADFSMGDRSGLISHYDSILDGWSLE